jgi:competence protein ComFC
MEKTILLDKVEVLILYKYNDFFKEILYRYKGCYDYLLKDAFLNNYIVRLKRKYKNYFIVCAPSYKGDDKKRGFNHITEIAKAIGLPIIDCLRKSKNYKQSDQKMKDRNAVKNIIKIDKSKLKNVKRVLILDDVTTSLSTLKTIIGLFALIDGMTFLTSYQTVIVYILLLIIILIKPNGIFGVKIAKKV